MGRMDAKRTRQVRPRVATSALALLLLSFGLGTLPACAQGGCGSACLPLEAIDPERAQLFANQLRLLVTSQYAEFDQFRESGRSVTNPGGNRARIQETTFFVEYGASPRFTASLLVPYVRKIQNTGRFGRRAAEGLGDLALFGRYELLRPHEDPGSPSLSLGLGVKFPTGDTDAPGDAPRLPPAFQTGSGAYDLLPTVSYFDTFGRYAVFGNGLLRLPLEANDQGYRFGNELELHLGLLRALPVLDGRLEALVSVDYLYAERDEDGGEVLPGRLRDGKTVLNTGGEFVNVTPGLRLRLAPRSTVQDRVSIPVHEDWNGHRERNVGQVAPDLTSQITFAFTAR